MARYLQELQNVSDNQPVAPAPVGNPVSYNPVKDTSIPMPTYSPSIPKVADFTSILARLFAKKKPMLPQVPPMPQNTNRPLPMASYVTRTGPSGTLQRSSFADLQRQALQKAILAHLGME